MKSLEVLKNEYTRLLDILAAFLFGIIVGAIITVSIALAIGIIRHTNG